MTCRFAAGKKIPHRLHQSSLTVKSQQWRIELVTIPDQHPGQTDQEREKSYVIPYSLSLGDYFTLCHGPFIIRMFIMLTHKLCHWRLLKLLISRPFCIQYHWLALYFWCWSSLLVMVSLMSWTLTGSALNNAMSSWQTWLDDEFWGWLGP